MNDALVDLFAYISHIRLRFEIVSVMEIVFKPNMMKSSSSASIFHRNLLDK